MFIPPSVIEGSKPEYRPEPFTPAQTLFSVETLTSSFASIRDLFGTFDSPVSGGQGITWPIKTFKVKLESTGEIIGMLVTGLLTLWWCLAYIDFRRGLLLILLPLWAIFHCLRSLSRKTSSNWRDSVRLDVDQLFHERGNNYDQDGIRYEQICMVKFARTTPNFSGPLEVDYYPYDDQTGSLNLVRIRARRLPVTEDDSSLYDEIRRRAYGPAPTQRAQLDLLAWRLFRFGIGLSAFFLYAFFIGSIGR